MVNWFNPKRMQSNSKLRSTQLRLMLNAHGWLLLAVACFLMLLSGCSTLTSQPTTLVRQPPASALTLCPPMLSLPSREANNFVEVVQQNFQLAATCARMHMESVGFMKRLTNQGDKHD